MRARGAFPFVLGRREYCGGGDSEFLSRCEKFKVGWNDWDPYSFSCVSHDVLVPRCAGLCRCQLGSSADEAFASLLLLFEKDSTLFVAQAKMEKFETVVFQIFVCNYLHFDHVGFYLIPFPRFLGLVVVWVG